MKAKNKISEKVSLLLLRLFIAIRYLHIAKRNSLSEIYNRYKDNFRKVSQMTTYERAYYCSNIQEVVRSYVYDNLVRKKTVINDCFSNVKLAIHPNNEMSRISYVTKTYEEETMNFLKRELSQDDVVLDIGANNGYYSLLCSTIAKKVIAFEPSPRDFSRLKENKELNKFDHLIIENFGLSDSEKKLEMLIANDYHSGQNTLESKFVYDISLKEKITIDLKPLDSYIKKANINKIDVIKIDVDGHEMNVLRGAEFVFSKMKPRAIIFEIVTEWPEKKADIEKFFTDLGYEIFAIDYDGKLNHVQTYSSGNLVAYKKS
jgi:FkbM family methyltransferase